MNREKLVRRFETTLSASCLEKLPKGGQFTGLMACNFNYKGLSPEGEECNVVVVSTIMEHPEIPMPLIGQVGIDTGSKPDELDTMAEQCADGARNAMIEVLAQMAVAKEMREREAQGGRSDVHDDGPKIIAPPQRILTPDEVDIR